MIVSFETIGNYVFALTYEKTGDYVTCTVYSAVVESLLTTNEYIDMFNLVDFDGNVVPDFKDAFHLFTVTAYLISKPLDASKLITASDLATELTFNSSYTLNTLELDAVVELITDVIKPGTLAMINGEELENQAIFNGNI